MASHSSRDLDHLTDAESLSIAQVVDQTLVFAKSAERGYMSGR